MIKKGFTLIEIMVVVGIIAILTSVAIMAGSSAKSVARDNQRKTDIRLIQLKLESFKEQNGIYPRDLTDHTSFPNLPKDPSGAAYTYVPLRFSGGECGISYFLYTTLENSKTTPNLIPKNSLTTCTETPLPADTQNLYGVTSPDAVQSTSANTSI